MLVTGAYSHPLAVGEFPAIEECLRRTAERPVIAPINAEHIQGLGLYQEYWCTQVSANPDGHAMHYMHVYMLAPKE